MSWSLFSECWALSQLFHSPLSVEPNQPTKLWELATNCFKSLSLEIFVTYWCRFDPRVRKIPWRRAWQPIPVFLPGESMEREPGGLQAMGLQRARHAWLSVSSPDCLGLFLVWIQRHSKTLTEPLSYRKGILVSLNSSYLQKNHNWYFPLSILKVVHPVHCFIWMSYCRLPVNNRGLLLRK